jgi:hypothetical protein
MKSILTFVLICHFFLSFSQKDSLPYTTGKVFIDANANGLMEANEIPLQNIFVKADSCSTTLVTCVNGNYYSPFCTLTDTLRVFLPDWADHCFFNPEKHFVFQDDYALNFPLIVDSLVQDIEILSMQFSSAIIPGTNVVLHIRYRNLAGRLSSPSLSLTSDVQLNWIQASPNFISNTGNLYAWNLPSLDPLQTGEIVVEYRVPASLVSGTAISLSAEVDAGALDVNPLNNIFETQVDVVNSVASERKTVFPEGVLDINVISDAPQLYYTIYFQNTSVDTVVNVRIVDTLSTLLQWQTFDLRGASHTCNYQIEASGSVAFYFSDIFLPPSVTNDAQSKGFISYSIRTKTSLELNDKILNTAHVFYDFNEAIVTNTTQTVIGIITEAEYGFSSNEAFRVYPNPATEFISIASNTELKAESYSLYDLTGKRMLTGYVHENTSINIKALDPGLYLLKIISKEQMTCFKIIKN